MKIRANMYELKRLYHGQDKSKRATPLDEYDMMYNTVVCALRTNALIQSSLNQDAHPVFVNINNERIYIQDQFLMPRNIVIELSHRPKEGTQYMTVIRNSLFQPRYIDTILQKLDGKKIDVSKETFDPTRIFLEYFGRK
jgi:hypothetical protein